MTSKSNEIYHTPLGRRDLRLLYPIRLADATVYEMKSHRLTEAPYYTAISYVWGDTSNMTAISVNGIAVMITQSLSGALRAVEGEARPMWADAVCINQQDDQEKARQILLMRSIYQKAASVAIWLGPKEEYDGFKFLHKFGCADNQLQVIKEIDELEMRGLARLFHRPYWGRIWVVQEVQLTEHDINVYCGTSNHSLNDYRAVNDLTKFHKDSFNGRLQGFTDPTTHASLLNTLARFGPARLFDAVDTSCHKEMSLLYKLSFHRDKKATEPQDKVYGILGLFPTQSKHKLLKPVCGRQARVVYINVAKYLIETQIIDVICEASFKNPSSSVSGLPSWVPDWSWRRPNPSLALTYPFNAGGRKAGNASISDDGLKLTVSAMPIGEILERGLSVDERSSELDIIQAVQRGLVMLARLHGTPVPEPVLKSFCQTIHLGQAPGEENWEAKFFSHFRWVHTEGNEFAFACEYMSKVTQLMKEPTEGQDERTEDVMEEDEPMEYIVKKDEPMEMEDSLARLRMNGMAFCTIQHGWVGMGPTDMMEKDQVVILPGCCMPAVLREMESGDWEYIGEIYVGGAMQGEVMEEAESGRRGPLKSYTLA